MGATPAFLMFGREIRTKLPELGRDKFVLSEEICDRDWRNKVPGDQVLLENTMSHTLWKPRRATSSLYSPRVETSTDEIVLL